MSNWIYFDPPKTPEMGFASGAKSGSDVAKDAVGKIAQLIPGPILGAYGAALGTLPLFSAAEQPLVGLLLYVLGIFGSAWIVYWDIGTGYRKVRHVLVYGTAFAVWAYSLTGSVALPWLYHHGLAALLPILASVVFYNVRLPKVESE